jgi:hypothetical protein
MMQFDAVEGEWRSSVKADRGVTTGSAHVGIMWRWSTIDSSVLHTTTNMPFHEITLNDGRKIPQIGFGSWKIPKDVCSGQVDQAIDVGFDHIDTAQGKCIMPQRGDTS